MTGADIRRKAAWAGPVLLAAAVLALPACQEGGHFTVLGYTTRPNYDTSICTVRVPIFKNVTYWRGLEFELTRAVIREIEQKTPYKVVGENADADTELTGTVLNFNQNILNRNQLNEKREAETTLTVQVEWRNLKTGEILSAPPLPAPPPGVLEVPPDAPPPPAPVLVQSNATYIPELGESITSARKKNVDRLAQHIVSMMETPW